MASTKVKEDEVNDNSLLKHQNSNTVLPFEKSLYEKNRKLFLIQSALLGISYAIVWPTLWMYVRTQFSDLTLPVQKILYGSVFIAYPMASMVSAYLVEKYAFSTRLLFILLNFSGIVGNLIYALNFHPICLFIGRFIAGIADAFYIVIMRDVKSTQNYKGGNIAAECLCGFVTGLILAQFLNAATFFIPFKLGVWNLSIYNYPGLMACFLFSIMALANRVFLSISDEENEYSQPPSSNDNLSFKVQLKSIQSWGLKTGFIAFYSFIHTYVVSMLEILIPILIYEKLQATPISAILFYGFIGLLYAMILMFTLSIKSPIMLECFMLLSVLFKMLALLASICIILVPMRTLYCVLALMAMMIAITFMWSNDDVMYNNLIISLLPFRVREYSHNIRKATSKLAFLLAGFTVPFLYSSAILYAGTIFTVMIGALFMMFIMIRTFSRMPSSNHSSRLPSPKSENKR